MSTTLTNIARWLLPATAALALAGCQTATVPDPGDPGLLRIGSCTELRDYASDVMLETLVDGKYGYGYWLDAAEGDDGAPRSDDGPSDFTTTNVQEEGVDELDIVKTDGRFVYVAQDRALHIVKSWPIADTEKVSTLELDGWVRGLFLKGDKVVVFHSPEPDADMKWGTRATIIDVTDREDPVIEREIDIEGWMADGRMIDGDVYLIFNHYLEMPAALWNLLDGRVALDEIEWDKYEGEALDRHIEDLKAKARIKLRPHVDRIARSMDLTDFLPSWKDQEIGEREANKELMHGCSSLYRPSGVGQHGAMSVVNLDLDDGDLSAQGLLSNGWQLYASLDNLYVAQSSRWWWWGGWDRELETHIHKFHLEADGEPEYVASGEVRGWAYDQFAFSEYDGYLRVATTDQDWWWGWWSRTDEDDVEPANNVFVLKDDGAGSLDVVGELSGIAPNERIYATRYFGDHAFMVTFQQIDPLFTIDLSNPKRPAVIGELKLPGYSAYLHPMGEDHLLAVGMDGDDEGRISGLAFNLFDVSDLKKPTLAHQYTLPGSDWSWSEALWDHHAFTYHRDVLTVPVFEYWNDRGGEDRYFSGVVSLSATEDGLSEIGRVDHRPLVRDSECLYYRWWGWEESVCAHDYWYARVRRSVYIEDNLFSLSVYGIRVTDLNDPKTEHARVLFYPEIR